MFEREDVGDTPPLEPGPPGKIEKLIGSIFMAAVASVFIVLIYDYFGAKGAIVTLAAWYGMQLYAFHSLVSTYKRDHYDDIR